MVQNAPKMSDREKADARQDIGYTGGDHHSSLG